MSARIAVIGAGVIGSAIVKRFLSNRIADHVIATRSARRRSTEGSP